MAASLRDGVDIQGDGAGCDPSDVWVSLADGCNAVQGPLEQHRKDGTNLKVDIPVEVELDVEEELDEGKVDLIETETVVIDDSPDRGLNIIPDQQRQGGDEVAPCNGPLQDALVVDVIGGVCDLDVAPGNKAQAAQALVLLVPDVSGVALHRVFVALGCSLVVSLVGLVAVLVGLVGALHLGSVPLLDVGEATKREQDRWVVWQLNLAENQVDGHLRVVESHLGVGAQQRVASISTSVEVTAGKDGTERNQQAQILWSAACSVLLTNIGHLGSTAPSPPPLQSAVKSSQ